jgi:hypothetical protein
LTAPAHANNAPGNLKKSRRHEARLNSFDRGKLSERYLMRKRYPSRIIVVFDIDHVAISGDEGAGAVIGIKV